MVEAMACKEEETSWVAFEDDEEALSLSDLPVVDRGEAAEGEFCRAGVNSGEEGDAAAGAAKCPEDENFEFRTCSGAGGLQLESAEAEMCVADEVFFQGQILPLRPSSVSSDSGLFPASRCGSRSDSMDRSSSSATGSLGFESSRSMSGRSSSSISRSQSTHSAASSCANDAPGRLSISNNFYAHPSPKPHVCSGRRKSTSSARKSTSSGAGSGWGLLRLGLVKTPEIDLDGLIRHRKPSAAAAAAAHNSASNRKDVANDDSGRSEKKAPTQLGIARCSSSSNTKFDARGINGSHKEEKPAEKKASWSLGNRLRCSCSPGDVVEATCSRIVVVAGGPEREMARLAPSPSLKRRQEGTCHSRTFQWLAELPVPKPPVA